MADYTPVEIVNMIKILRECHDNYKAAARLYAERYPDARHPTRRNTKLQTIRAQGGNLPFLGDQKINLIFTGLPEKIQ